MNSKIRLILLTILLLLFVSCNQDDLKKWFVTGDFVQPYIVKFYLYKNVISESNNTVIVGIQFSEKVRPYSVIAYLIDEFNIKYKLKFLSENISADAYIWIGYAEIPYENYSQNEVDFEIIVEDAKDFSGNALKKPSYVLENTYKVLSRHKVFLEREYPLETNTLDNTYQKTSDKQPKENTVNRNEEEQNNFVNEQQEEKITMNQTDEQDTERKPSVLIQKRGTNIDYSQTNREFPQLKEPILEVIDVFQLGNYASKTNPYITVVIRVKSPKPIVDLVAYLVIQNSTEYPLYIVNVSKVENDYAIIASYPIDLSWIKDQMELWEFDVLVENLIDEEGNYLANPFKKEGFKMHVSGRDY